MCPSYQVNLSNTLPCPVYFVQLRIAKVKPSRKVPLISTLQWYTDDGYSGANFQRPGFQAMLADIEAGKVGTVIVKDMSRLGRNYLQVGMYTEMIFPQKGVRFL